MAGLFLIALRRHRPVDSSGRNVGLSPSGGLQPVSVGGGSGQAQNIGAADDGEHRSVPAVQLFSSLTVVHERYLFQPPDQYPLHGGGAMPESGHAVRRICLCEPGGRRNPAQSDLLRGLYHLCGVPPEHPAPVRVALPRSSAGDLCIFAFAFLSGMVDILYWGRIKLIIGWAVGAAAVTIYNVGASFSSYVTNTLHSHQRRSDAADHQHGRGRPHRKEFSDLFIKDGAAAIPLWSPYHRIGLCGFRVPCLVGGGWDMKRPIRWRC